MNHNSAGKRRIVRRSCVAVPLLVAALLAFWCRGEEWVFQPEAGSQRFIAPDMPRVISLELRDEVVVFGGSVRLKQVIRCGEADAAALDRTLDLVVCKIEKPGQSRDLELASLKRVLEEAGINLLTIHFSGPTSCRVSRMDDPGEAQVKERARQSAQVVSNRMLAAAPGTRPAAVASSSIAPLEPAVAPLGPFRTLRELLIREVAERLSLDADSLSVRFRPEDEKLVSLGEPGHRFSIMARRSSNIGDVTWDVLITGQQGEKKAAITASVKLWQTQLVTARALAFRQVIRDEDIRENRVLVDRLSGDQPLSKEQLVGCEAAREIPPGVVLNNRMVQARQLIRTGQLIHVTVDRNGVILKWVAEARENGVFGQIIRIRRPGTRDEFHARVSGEEQATLVGASEEAPVAARR